MGNLYEALYIISIINIIICNLKEANKGNKRHVAISTRNITSWWMFKKFLNISTIRILRRRTLLNFFRLLQICVRNESRKKLTYQKKRQLPDIPIILCPIFVDLSWWKKNINQINTRHNSYCSECINLTVKRKPPEM